MNNNETSQYQTLPEFQIYLWFLAQWANFSTPFLLASEIAETKSEQDEIRPILSAMASQYIFAKSAGTLLHTGIFWNWWNLNAKLDKIQTRYADAWLASH